jgi:hypothetical protein
LKNPEEIWDSEKQKFIALEEKTNDLSINKPTESTIKKHTTSSMEENDILLSEEHFY